MRQTLVVLSRHGVKLKLVKCQFGMKKIKYLGHILDEHGVHVDPSYVDAVKKMPHPTNLSELRTFLGMCGYYRRFIASYADIAQPLHELLKQGTAWTWNDKHQQCRRQAQAGTYQRTGAGDAGLQEAIHHSDRRKHVWHRCGAGQRLEEEDGKLVEKPIAYVSRGLKPAETRYSATHLEMLAVMYSLTKFRHYVFGSRFLIQTDHKALEGLVKTRDPQGRLARWINALQEYDYVIEYRKGKANANADALSRLPESSATDHDIDINVVTGADYGDEKGGKEGSKRECRPNR